MNHLAHLADRTVLRIGGPEARDFLQGQLTNDLRSVSPTTPLYAGHLTAQGKTLFAMLLHAEPESPDVLIDVDATQAEALARRLTMFRLRRPVTIAPEPALAVWARWPATDSPDPRAPALGDRWLAAPDAHIPNTDVAAYHAHRVSHSIPESTELTDLLWLDTGADALHGVSYTKGCYVGQENTARMHHRDRVRGAPAAIETAAELPPGTPLFENGREAGTIRGPRHGTRQIAWLRSGFSPERVAPA